MNRTFPKLLAILFLFILFQFSCKQEEKKNSDTNEANTPEAVVPEAVVPEAGGAVESISSTETQVFTTKSGKIFELTGHSNSDGIYDYHIVPQGFEFTRDTFIVSEADPLSKAFLEDLDDNGFEEIYLITTSVGSGSYGNIYGYSSNSDKSVSPIYIPPIHENDLAPGALYEGYMGHDSIYLDKGKLMRQFPIYLEGDPNCCPTGGKATIAYKLVPGEATWQLRASKQ